MEQGTMNTVPLVRDVCLLGGGHSHVLLIRQWAMKPMPGVRLTLVSSATQTPYSGMLPGLVAGHYSVSDIHIDLRNLCTWAGVRFIEQTADSVDLDNKRICFATRPGIDFDVLSLDTGSTPDLGVPGAARHVTPVKPISDFYARWQEIRTRLEEPQAEPLTVAVVGSGAGGFELVTAIRHTLPQQRSRVHWILRDEEPLRGRPKKVGRLALESALRAGIEVVTRFDVRDVGAGKLRASDGRELACDEVLWCTGAVGPAWLAESGLLLDKRGFVATNAYLQSISHDFVFATGDIGTQINSPSAKAGVFAVRQAPVLFENLRHSVLGEDLKIFNPQGDFLSLMATGPKRAIASRGPIAIEADWVWLWKDHIDQKFMRLFTDLPRLNMNASLNRLPNALHDLAAATGPDAMLCKGCGSKVGDAVLERVLASLGQPTYSVELTDSQSGTRHSPARDTAVVEWRADSLVQSVDQINAIVDDPYVLGRMAVVHALSDVVTVDAVPVSAQVVVTLPRGVVTMVERDLTQLMSGIVEVLEEESCQLLGGHTVQGGELSVAVVINGHLRSADKDRSQVMRVTPGDVLVLTQPLGTGTLFAGHMLQQTSGDDISNAIDFMLTSNTLAANLLREHGCAAMTDVTGFGLTGHLRRLLVGLGTGAVVESSLVPMLNGAEQLAANGIRSSLWQDNRQVMEQLDVNATLGEDTLSLLCDPQTGGGLLAIVPANQLSNCLSALHESNFQYAVAIGAINESSKISIN